MRETSAEILTIGTELLLGEILDTNSKDIGLCLREIGINIYRTMTVGDNRDRIAQAISEASQRADVLITSGGLGPTVDDATREGVAKAFGLETEFYPELWEDIKTRFALFGRTPTDNNRNQARLPMGAVPIRNPVGTAPGFILEVDNCSIIAVPGVPSEMKYLLEKSVVPYLCEQFELEAMIKTRILRTAGQGESWLDEKIRDLEESSNPTLGISAHPGRVDLRITAKAATKTDAENMIQEMEYQLRERIGEHIYGVDNESLESATLALLKERGWKIATVEVGTQGLLSGSLSPFVETFQCGWVLPSISNLADLEAQLLVAMRSHNAEVGLAAAVQRTEEQVLLWLHLESPFGPKTRERSFGGAPQNAPAWAESLALDFLRRFLLGKKTTPG
jgi:competence/damage-inducible protein CinA-like protein